MLNPSLLSYYLTKARQLSHQHYERFDLVSPRVPSPSSHCTYLALVSNSKRKLDYLKIFSPVKLITPSTQYPKNLSELEDMICQNVEFFEATREVTVQKMEFEAVGSTRTRQVGLRCIHCGQTPFVKSCFSTVFPRRIPSIAASLHHMAEIHFIKCIRIPSEIGNKFCYFARIVDQERSYNYKEKSTCKNIVYIKAALDLFCIDLCERISIENDNTSKSGLVCTRTMHDEQSSLHKKFDDMVDDTMLNVSCVSRNDNISKPDLA